MARAKKEKEQDQLPFEQIFCKSAAKQWKKIDAEQGCLKKTKS